jgi:hypothetical protein
MKGQGIAVEKEIAEEMVDEFKEYQAYKGEEALGPSLSAQQLSSEIKEAMGIDVFPEDIQNDILALSQKVADYVLQLTEQSGEEGWSPQGQRLINCAADIPSRQITKEAWKASSTAARFAVGPLKPFKTAIRIGAFGAYSLGAAAGSYAGCVQRGGFRPPVQKPGGFGFRR